MRDTHRSRCFHAHHSRQVIGPVLIYLPWESTATNHLYSRTYNIGPCCMCSLIYVSIHSYAVNIYSCLYGIYSFIMHLYVILSKLWRFVHVLIIPLRTVLRYYFLTIFVLISYWNTVRTREEKGHLVAAADWEMLRRIKEYFVEKVNLIDVHLSKFYLDM